MSSMEIFTQNAYAKKKKKKNTWAASSEKVPSNMRKMHIDHPAHVQIIIQAFALHSCILQYPMILLADSEGPDQSARMRRLI